MHTSRLYKIFISSWNNIANFLTFTTPFTYHAEGRSFRDEGRVLVFPFGPVGLGKSEPPCASSLPSGPFGPLLPSLASYRYSRWGLGQPPSTGQKMIKEDVY